MFVPVWRFVEPAQNVRNGAVSNDSGAMARSCCIAQCAAANLASAMSHAGPQSMRAAIMTADEKSATERGGGPARGAIVRTLRAQAGKPMTTVNDTFTV